MAARLLAQAIPFSRASRRRRELLAKAGREAAAGRKLAIFDRETGLESVWYFSRRMEEELTRSTRYGHHFAIVLLEAPRASGEQALTGTNELLVRSTRAADLSTHLGDGRFLILLPQADPAAAAAFRARMLESIPAGLVGLGCFPEDGASVEALRAAAEQDLRAQRIIQRLRLQS